MFCFVVVCWKLVLLFVSRFSFVCYYYPVFFGTVSSRRSVLMATLYPITGSLLLLTAIHDNDDDASVIMMIMMMMTMMILIAISGVTRERGWGEGADRPWWHHPGGDTRMKLIFVAELTNNTKQTVLEGGEGHETIVQTRSSLVRGRWLKGSSLFWGKK